jgi:hypothetical protein
VMKWMRVVQESGGNVGRSMIALRTIDSRVVEMLMQTGLVLAHSVGKFVWAHGLCRIELVAVS